MNVGHGSRKGTTGFHPKGGVEVMEGRGQKSRCDEKRDVGCLGEDEHH